jgi:hypothetical protein
MQRTANAVHPATTFEKAANLRSALRRPREGVVGVIKASVAQHRAAMLLILQLMLEEAFGRLSGMHVTASARTQACEVMLKG